MPIELSVLRRPAPSLAARPPTGARHCSGSGNAITEFWHQISQGLGFWPQNTEHGYLGFGTPRVCPQPNSLVKPTPTRTGLVPSTRFAPCGAAYRGR